MTPLGSVGQPRCPPPVSLMPAAALRSSPAFPGPCLWLWKHAAQGCRGQGRLQPRSTLLSGWGHGWGIASLRPRRKLPGIAAKGEERLGGLRAKQVVSLSVKI